MNFGLWTLVSDTELKCHTGSVLGPKAANLYLTWFIFPHTIVYENKVSIAAMKIIISLK